MEYRKRFETYDQLADRLLSRGLQADRYQLVRRLREIGYYRLSGYWHIFKQADGTFVDGTTLERVMDIYSFDRLLRLKTLDAIERAEVYLRSNIAHELASINGPFGYLNANSMPNFSPSQYTDFLSRCRKAFERSREPFALHYREKYADSQDLPPYWILVGTLEFGAMFALYRGASNDTRKCISRTFFIEPKVMDSWLVALNTVRNICCHHGRLWNRTLGTRPALPRQKNDARWHEPFAIRADKPIAVLTILSHMLTTVTPDSTWAEEMTRLLETRPESDLSKMGFAEGWRKSPFWATEQL